MYDALYARQSVEKVDSISIESQLEYCRHEARGQSLPGIYRPGVQRQKYQTAPPSSSCWPTSTRGKVARVIVYKLDRISRSILDFANMMQLFQQHRGGVCLLDRAVRHLHPHRQGDAAHLHRLCPAGSGRPSRSGSPTPTTPAAKRGCTWVGRVPYGFARQQTMLDGVRTSMFVPVPQEARQVQLIYSLYADPANSLGDLVRYLNAHGHKQLRGGMWEHGAFKRDAAQPGSMSGRTPRSTPFFKEQGAQILNPAADFTGYNGCYLYKGAGGEGAQPVGFKRQGGRAGPA